MSSPILEAEVLKTKEVKFEYKHSKFADPKELAKHLVHSEELVAGLITDKQCFLHELEEIYGIMTSSLDNETKLKKIFDLVEWYEPQD